jgi:hypothetical protein
MTVDIKHLALALVLRLLIPVTMEWSQSQLSRTWRHTHTSETLHTLAEWSVRICVPQLPQCYANHGEHLLKNCVCILFTLDRSKEVTAKFPIPMPCSFILLCLVIREIVRVRQFCECKVNLLDTTRAHKRCYFVLKSRACCVHAFTLPIDELPTNEQNKCKKE